MSINTLHKGDDDDDNNNNKSKSKRASKLKLMAANNLLVGSKALKKKCNIK